MSKKESKEAKDKHKKIVDEIMETVKEEQCAGDMDLTGLDKEIYDMLQELPDIKDKATSILNVLSHDQKLLNAILGRLTYELLMQVTLTCIVADGNIDEDRIAWTLGKSISEHGEGIMKKYFPTEREAYKKRNERLMKEKKE